MLVLFGTSSLSLGSGGQIGALAALVCGRCLLTLLQSFEHGFFALLIGQLLGVRLLVIFLGLLCLCLLLLLLVGGRLFGIGFFGFLGLGISLWSIGFLGLLLDIHFFQNTLKLFVLKFLLFGLGKFFDGLFLLGRLFLGLLSGLGLIRRFLFI